MAEAPRPRKFIGRRAAEAAAAANGAASTLGRSDEVVAARPAATKRFVKQQVPDDILYDEALNEAIAVLPPNYNFEIHKTVARIRQLGARRVALQFPEGLLMYACVIADILESHAGVQHAFVMGDVTYGACCVDDFSALALRADLLVHYGHSCLVPVDVTKVPCMYVFVDIGVDVRHLVGTVRANFPAGANIALAGTIQFGSSIQAARQELAGDYPSLRVPQARPLSPGEVLGCTAPVVPPETDAIIFVADGRFHLEAIMIANPAVPAFRYDPYAREMTAEQYDQAGMRAARRAAVEAGAPAQQWGIVLGTLGRQGNPRIVRHLQSVLARQGRSHITVLLSEVLPSKLAMFRGIDAWVQVACPRLSIDWGEAFTTPTLTPYEALIALGEVPPWWKPSSQLTDSSHGQAAAQPAQQAAAPSGTGTASQPHQQQPQRPVPAAAPTTTASPLDAESRAGAGSLQQTAAAAAAAGQQLAGMSVSDQQAAAGQATDAQQPSHTQLPADAQRLAHSQQTASAQQSVAAQQALPQQPTDVQEPVRDALHRPPACGIAVPPPQQPQPSGTAMAAAATELAAMTDSAAAAEAQQSGARAGSAITAVDTPAASDAATAGGLDHPQSAAATAAGPEPQRPATDATTQPATSATPAVMRQPTSSAAATGTAASEVNLSVSGAAAEMPQPPAAIAAADSELATGAMGQGLPQSPAAAEAADSQPAAGATAEERQRRRDRRQAFDAYPMDYYAKDGGPWGSSYAPKPSGGAAAKLAAMRAARS